MRMIQTIHLTALAAAFATCSTTAYAVRPCEPSVKPCRTYGQIVKVPYSMGQDDLVRLTFPLVMHTVPKVRGYYFAQHFGFTYRPDEDVGYMGFQPLDGGKTFRAIFSVFGKGAEVMDHEHCRSGADGGPGVSCSRSGLPFKPGKTYTFTVVRNEMVSNGVVTWNGYVTDDNTHIRKWLVGRWAVPLSWGGLASHHGFVEQYIPVPCKEMPYSDVSFAHPFGVNRNGDRIQGYIEKPVVSQQGSGKSSCKSCVTHAIERLGDGARIKVGQCQNQH